MARVDYPDPTRLDPGTVELLDKLPPLNLFRMMAYITGQVIAVDGGLSTLR